MKWSELTRKLKQAGWQLTAHGKKHDEWRHPDKPYPLILPRHKGQEAKTGIANSILKQAGLK